MKQRSKPVWPVMISVVAVALGRATPAVSQTFSGPVLPADSATLARLTADLAYPNSSQRVFKAGNDQIEQEIQRLLADDPPDPFLTIAPEIQEQFEE